MAVQFLDEGYFWRSGEVCLKTRGKQQTIGRKKEVWGVWEKELKKRNSLTYVPRKDGQISKEMGT